MAYHHDTFYKTNHLSLKKKKELLEEVKERSYQWMVDRHDDNGVRRPIAMSWEDILARLNKKCHFVFIHRKGYTEHMPADGSEWLLETGFCTMGEGNDLFLWVNCDEKEIPYFVEKYKLNQML